MREAREAGGSMSDGVAMELLCKIADVAKQIEELQNTVVEERAAIQASPASKDQ